MAFIRSLAQSLTSIALLFACVPVATAQCLEGQSTVSYRLTAAERVIDAVHLDSGWVPSGSPLQIRLGVDVAAESVVRMDGPVRLSWPTALRAEPLEEGVGTVDVDYGAEVTARARFDVTVAGRRYVWEGDIPFGSVPRDLRVFAHSDFTPWGFERTALARDATESIPVVAASLGSLIAIPGVDGGLELRASLAADASYQTSSLGLGAAVLTSRMPVDIAVADPLGSRFRLPVTAEGTLFWGAEVVLSPQLFIDVAGTRFDMAVAEIPLRIVQRESPLMFPEAAGDFLLPDLVVESNLDTSALPLGETRDGQIVLRNVGAAELVVAPIATGGIAISGETIRLPAGARVSLSAQVRGVLEESTLRFASNDPDACDAEAFRVPAANAPPTGGDVMDVDAGVLLPPTMGVARPDGCSCSSSSASNLWAVLFVAVAIRRRRAYRV